MRVLVATLFIGPENVVFLRTNALSYVISYLLHINVYLSDVTTALKGRDGDVIFRKRSRGAAKETATCGFNAFSCEWVSDGAFEPPPGACLRKQPAGAARRDQLQTQPHRQL